MIKKIVIITIISLLAIEGFIIYNKYFKEEEVKEVSSKTISGGKEYEYNVKLTEDGDILVDTNSKKEKLVESEVEEYFDIHAGQSDICEGNNWLVFLKKDGSISALSVDDLSCSDNITLKDLDLENVVEIYDNEEQVSSTEPYYYKVYVKDKNDDIEDITSIFLNENDENNNYQSYKVGDKIKVKLNNTLEQDFYVLKDSSSNEENITLFAVKNIGTSAFNNDYSDGNEFAGSLIESKLNDLTSNWSNVIEKRLITVEEIKNTNLTEEININKCVDEDCFKDYTYINKDSFLLYPNEFYWTMTKVDSSNESTGNTNRFVYFVDSDGGIDQHIVGYKVGSENNLEGNAFKNFGIRPVIVISKEYVN